jgi:CheY-like chemotaxis protein
MPATILVAEDEASIIDLVGLYLAREGFRVHAARDGEAAVEAARAGRGLTGRAMRSGERAAPDGRGHVRGHVRGGRHHRVEVDDRLGRQSRHGGAADVLDGHREPPQGRGHLHAQPGPGQVPRGHQAVVPAPPPATSVSTVPLARSCPFSPLWAPIGCDTLGAPSPHTVLQVE